MEDREQSTWKKVAGNEKAKKREGGRHLHLPQALKKSTPVEYVAGTQPCQTSKVKHV